MMMQRQLPSGGGLACSSGGGGKTAAAAPPPPLRRISSSYGRRCAPQPQQQQQQQLTARRAKNLHRAAAAADPAPAPAPAAMDEERAREVRAEVTKRIKALGAQKRLKDAVAELAGLSKVGVEPDVQAATALVAACAQAGNMEMAESVFEQLFGDFLEPDEVAFAVLLRGYGAKRPPQWGAIDGTLARMRSAYGLAPGARAFNALLEVCVATGDADRAMDVIDRMAADGVAPDERTLQVVARKRNLRSYLRKQLGGG